MTNPRTPISHPSDASHNTPALPTFMDHIYELRGRLFWIAIVFLVSSAAAYPYYRVIIDFLVAPLGSQELYYLTPIGGFSFIIKVCTYVGMILTLPAAIYHLYKYLQPVVGQIKGRIVLGYVLFSLFLSISGTAFAYYVILPAALHFLTNFNVQDVTAMLTVDSYLSFVITYLLGASVLFQLPLVLLIINAITPLSPRNLMKYQRYVLLGAFVAAAIISPTPDVTNQTLLAVPIIVMYQLGIVLIWLRNMLKRPAKKSIAVASKQKAPKRHSKHADIFEIKQPPFRVHVSAPPLPERAVARPRPLHPVAPSSTATSQQGMSAMKPMPLTIKPVAPAQVLKNNSLVPQRPMHMYGRPQPVARPQRPVQRSYVSPAMRQVRANASPRSIDGFAPTRQLV